MHKRQRSHGLGSIYANSSLAASTSETKAAIAGAAAGAAVSAAGRSGRMYSYHAPDFRQGGWKNDGTELKYIDNNGLAGTPAAGGGIVGRFNDMAQGDDVQNRIGRQVKVRSFELRGIVFPEDTTTVDTLVKVSLVWDKQPNSAVVPGVADIFNADASTSFINLNNRKRFTILKEQLFAVGATNNTATQAFAHAPSLYKIDWKVNLKNRLTTYSGTGSSNTIATGALLLVLTSTAAAGQAASVGYSTRLRFTDA